MTTTNIQMKQSMKKKKTMMKGKAMMRQMKMTTTHPTTSPLMTKKWQWCPIIHQIMVQVKKTPLIMNTTQTDQMKKALVTIVWRSKAAMTMPARVMTIHQSAKKY